MVALFAATFDHVEPARDRVMAGITRYAHKQAALEAADRGPAPPVRPRSKPLETKDFDRMDEVEKQLDWATRIFQDRQQSLTYVCETPVILEQRAFALGRAAQALPAREASRHERFAGDNVPLTFGKKAWALPARRPNIPCSGAGGESCCQRGGETWNNVPCRAAASDVARVAADHSVADVLIVDDHPLMCDALSATLGYRLRAAQGAPRRAASPRRW